MKPKFKKEFTKPKPHQEQEFTKTVPVIRDLGLNPLCQHGPTILFERDGSRFFSCSAYRSRKLCPFYCSEDEWVTVQCQPELEKTSTQEDDNGMDKDKKKRRKISSEIVITPASRRMSVITPISTSTSDPLTLSLPSPTQRDQGEAQYHFTDGSVNFFINLFQEIGIYSVVCVGTPSLHQALMTNTLRKIDSFLLDIDDRLIKQFPSKDAALYNMCNHHFLQGNKEKYEQFLKNAESLVIVTDPPFGARVELVWNGALKCIKEDFYMVHPVTSTCEILWIFPYFMEGHILSKCPESGLKMSDYKVLYKNHAKFKEKVEGNGNGKSSPVRIFTTIPLSLIKLPEQSYRYCDICRKWVERRNLHCGICETCPTKDGGDTYIHCRTCRKCVKPTWSHCDSPCGTCHLTNSGCRKPNSFSIPRTSTYHKVNKVMIKQASGSKLKKLKRTKNKRK